MCSIISKKDKINHVTSSIFIPSSDKKYASCFLQILLLLRSVPKFWSSWLQQHGNRSIETCFFFPLLPLTFVVYILKLAFPLCRRSAVHHAGRFKHKFEIGFSPCEVELTRGKMRGSKASTKLCKYGSLSMKVMECKHHRISPTIAQGVFLYSRSQSWPCTCLVKTRAISQSFVVVVGVS